MVKGRILPDHKDILMLYLAQAKDEDKYVSNTELAEMLFSVLEPEDAEDVAAQLLDLTQRYNG